MVLGGRIAREFARFCEAAVMRDSLPFRQALRRKSLRAGESPGDALRFLFAETIMRNEKRARRELQKICAIAVQRAG